MADRTWHTENVKELLGELLACSGSTTGAVNLREGVRRLIELEVETLEKRVRRLVDEAQRKKYYAARFAWRHRAEMTPGTRKDEKGKPVASVTWATWFEQMWHDSLERYMAECKERDTLKSVYEYEMAEFGSSALEPDMKRREQRKAVA